VHVKELVSFLSIVHVKELVSFLSIVHVKELVSFVYCACKRATGAGRRVARSVMVTSDLCYRRVSFLISARNSL
jgi:hypothetical protein